MSRTDYSISTSLVIWSSLSYRSCPAAAKPRWRRLVCCRQVFASYRGRISFIQSDWQTQKSLAWID